MSREKIIEEIADILEIDVEEVIEEKKLDDFDTWDSVAVLSVIAIMNEWFGRYPHADEIRKLITVGDLIEQLSE